LRRPGGSFIGAFLGRLGGSLRGAPGRFGDRAASMEGAQLVDFRGPSFSSSSELLIFSVRSQSGLCGIAASNAAARRLRSSINYLPAGC
jgi:hypothetical protein